MLARLALALLLCLSLVAVGQDPPPVSAQSSPVTVTLNAEGKAAAVGSVTLTAVGNTTQVVIQFTGDTTGSHPAEIHEGACPAPQPTAKIPLNNVVNGSSTTTLPIPLAVILGFQHAIVLHPSMDQLGTQLACGTIATFGPPAPPLTPPPSPGLIQTPLSFALSPAPSSTVSGTVTLTPQSGGTLTQVAIQLTNDPGGSHPAHFHRGVCPTPHPTPKIPLNNVISGTSTTLLPFSINQLIGLQHALEVHLSDTQMGVVLACGTAPHSAGAAAGLPLPVLPRTVGPIPQPTQQQIASVTQPVTFSFTPAANSVVTGTATLTPLAGGAQTQVTIQLANDPGGDHPAHFHDGACPVPSPTPKIPLNDVISGTSTTVLPIPTAALRLIQHAVEVHASPDLLGTPLTCATVPLLSRAPFTDVAASPFNTDIQNLYARGLTTGFQDNTYRPEQSVTRAEMAVFLLRAIHGEGYTPPAVAGTRFADVPSTDFFAPWIEQLANEGITNGCNPPALDQFCPTGTVTRDQMAIFLVRAKLGANPSPALPDVKGDLFADVGAGTFGAQQIETAYRLGITTGFPCGSPPAGACDSQSRPYFVPSLPVTRGQMAAFLIRAFPLPNGDASGT